MDDVTRLITEIHTAALECDRLWHEYERLSTEMDAVLNRRSDAKLRLIKAQRALVLALVGPDARVP